VTTPKRAADLEDSLEEETCPHHHRNSRFAISQGLLHASGRLRRNAIVIAESTVRRGEVLPKGGVNAKRANRMNALRRNLLPLILAVLPMLVLLLGAVSTLDTFAGLRNTAEFLDIIFFLGPILFFDWIGLIRFNILGGDPELFGSVWAAEATYALSCSLVLFIAGKLILKLLYNRRQ
jgi:hypothetical protein